MAQTPLRILFISGFVPPHSPMGAVRTGKLEAWWRASGHDVRTIAVSPHGAAVDPAAHPHLHYIPYEEPGRWITRVKAALTPSRPARDTAPSSTAPGPAPDATRIRTLGLTDLYRQVMQFPDRHRAWIGAAVRLALSWRNEWKPDVIYSSGPPHSGQVIAARLSSRLGVPWIAEMRDLWIDDPYLDRHPLLKPFHDWFARMISARASGFVVVTEEARAGLARFTKKPIVLSYNGYDLSDFAGMETVAPLDAERLTIIHAGTIYLGRRDPTPLFQAIAALGPNAAKIRCLFYSDTNGAVAALARRLNVEASVEIRDAVPRAQILRVEREVDILLECRWIDPAGDGVIPGKLFEYIGARRPILSLGSLTGEAAAIVRDNHLGLVSNDPDEIKAMLVEALEVKAQFGRLPDRPASDDKFRRDSQFRKIDGLIRDVLMSPTGAPAAVLQATR
jgi:hypothetical protein